MVKYSKIYQFLKGDRTAVNAFLYDELMLDTEYARILYHKYAQNTPVVCSLGSDLVSEIYENKAPSNLTELWIYHDKKRQNAMRGCGCEEKFVTGAASDYDKFREYCRIMPKLAGSSVYCLSHIELKRYFDCELSICPQNCERIWKTTAERLLCGGMRTSELLERSNVKAVCVELDACDGLEAFEHTHPLSLVPVFSPDRGLCIERRGIKKYIARLQKSSGIKVESLAELERAYLALLDSFASVGCLIALHSADVLSAPHFPDPYHADIIFKKALASDGADVTPDEAGLFKCQMLRFWGNEYKKRGIVMQIYPDRTDESRARALPRLGEKSPDAYSREDRAERLASILNYLSQSGVMPKTLICVSQPSETDRLLRFSSETLRRELSFKIYCHSGNLSAQLNEFADIIPIGSLCGFASESCGVLAGSEYELFGRALCSFVGGLCERGLYPWDEDALGNMVRDIMYRNEAELLGI